MAARCAVMLLVVAASGCGDGIDCPADLGLELVSPAGGPVGLADDRGEQPGVQVDVVLRSVLQAGEPAELVVTGADGGEARHGATAGEGGEIRFPLVTLPTGDVALVVTGESRRCGSDEVALALSVLGPACALALAEPSFASDHYRGAVLNQAADADPAAPGFQAHAEITSEPGFEVEVFSRSGGEEISAGITVADGGQASLPLTLPQGPVELRAECRAREGGEASATLAQELYVDTVAPVCALESPMEGAVLGPSVDEAPAAGVQVTARGRVLGDDVEGEPARFTAAGQPVAGSPIDQAGATSALVSFAAGGPAALELSARDHAENDCTAGVAVSIDVAAPPAPDGLALAGLDRQGLEISLVTPAEGGAAIASYEIRLATRPFTDDNFDSLGVGLPAPSPGEPGQTRSLVVDGLRPGTRYHAGAVSIDGAGNRSPVVSAGPLVLRLDAAAPVAAGDRDGLAGWALASGRLDGDGFADLVVGAPRDDRGAADGGSVRLHRGGEGGLSAAPARTYGSATAGGRFGAALAVLDWNDDGQGDLAIGAPGAGGSGRVFIRLGPLDGGPADAVISVAPSSAALAGGELGAALATADFDGDGRDDLLIGAPGAGGGRGAALVLFGGPTGAIALDEGDPDGPAGYLVAEPAGIAGGRFGQQVAGLGATENPLDPDDDAGVAYRDQDVAFVLRGRPRPASGLAPLLFDPDADLRLENPTTDATTGFGARMASIGDQDGDGTRELVVSAWLQGRGWVHLVRGGLRGVQQVSGAAVLATIVGAADLRNLGAAVADPLATGAADIDMDGREDLVVTGDAGRLRLHVWFGGSIPPGRSSSAEAPYQVTGPVRFTGDLPPGGLPAALVWAGDVNADGLDDLAWADPAAAAFQLLWDQ